MGSAKLLTILVASIFLFSGIRAGPCVATSTSSALPPPCTLPPSGIENTVPAPALFSLGFETCDGSYGGTYRMAGDGNAGDWVWSALSFYADQLSLDTDGHAVFESGVLIAAERTDVAEDRVSWIYPDYPSTSDWPRLTCYATARDNTKYLRCIGVDATYFRFQLCPFDEIATPRIYLAPEVKPGCKETNLVIYEIPL